MKTISFKESNRDYAANQPEYNTLPCWRDSQDREGRIVCLWQLSWKERLRVLFTGHVWHQILTFGKPLQPQLLQTDKPEMEVSDVTR
jgi:hypothetical protein